MKPMLSGRCTDLTKLRYPVLVSPKLDGVRALVLGAKLVSRNLKLIPNLELQERYSHPEFEGFDGELIGGAFLETTSTVMSKDKSAERVRFQVFDRVPPPIDWGMPFAKRLASLKSHPMASIEVVQHTLVEMPAQVTELEDLYLSQGHEGLMIRAPNGPYKLGRSTEQEGYLLKLKRFEDAEAVVVGMEEQMHNTNELTRDNLGHAKRTAHQAGMVGKGTLGALVVRGLNGAYRGVQYNVGTGFDDSLRADLWTSGCVGRVVKVKYFPTGSKVAPRFPVFLGFRDQGE